MKLVRSGAVLGVLSTTLLACSALVGMRDLGDQPAAASDEAGSATDGAVDGRVVGEDGPTELPDASIPADADASVTSSVPGGTVHFLQSGSSLVVTNGIEDVTVTANGPFGFSSDAGALAVKTNPIGQRCFVRNGNEIRCSVILTSRTAPSTMKTTTSTTFVALPDVTPITVTTDIAAKALVSLVVPTALTTDGSYNLGIQVDGTTVTEITNVPFNTLNGASTIAVVRLEAGTHTITPVWRIGDLPAVAGTVTATIYDDVDSSALSAIVLDSLPSFDRADTTSLTAVPALAAADNGGDTPVTITAAPISYDLTQAQPALLALVAPGVNGDRVNVGIRADQVPFSSWAYSFDVNATRIRTPMGLGVASLAAGSHTIDAQWVRIPAGRNTVTRDTSLAGALSSILFHNDVPAGTQRMIGNPQTNLSLTSTFATIIPAGQSNPLSTTITLPHPSKVLVTFDMDTGHFAPQWPTTVDLAIFVNGNQAQTIRVTSPDDQDYNMHGATIFDVVDVATTTATIDVRIRLSQPTGSNRSGSPTGIISFLNATGWSTMGIGAIALE